MLQLQQRAHYSLEEFRRGNINAVVNRYPPGSEPVSPDNDNDELAMLGGKTRLVAKVEPSSPQLMERSPNSLNPIVPLPLSPTMHHQMDPSVVEYLHSFGPPSATTNGGGPSSAGSGTQIGSQRGSFSTDVNVDLSPVSMYGMSTLDTSTTYPQDASSYMSPQSQQPQGMRHAGPPHHQQHHHHPSHSNGSIHDVTMGSASSSTAAGGGAGPSIQSFPQYFPVFDYGTGMMNGNTGTTAAGSANAYGGAPILETPSPPGVQRRSSGSPEGNMHSTWQDFVIGLQMT